MVIVNRDVFMAMTREERMALVPPSGESVRHVVHTERRGLDVGHGRYVMGCWYPKGSIRIEEEEE